MPTYSTFKQVDSDGDERHFGVRNAGTANTAAHIPLSDHAVGDAYAASATMDMFAGLGALRAPTPAAQSGSSTWSPILVDDQGRVYVNAIIWAQTGQGSMGTMTLGAGSNTVGKVGLKPFTVYVTGELAGSTSVATMPSIACEAVMFKASYDNVGRVYIGAGTATLANGSTDTTTGLQLNAGECTPWMPTDNLNRFCRICDNAGDDLTYIAMQS